LSEDKLFSDCTRCGECLTACPEKVLTSGDGGFPELHFNSHSDAFLGNECTFCEACAEACPELLFIPADQRKEREPWNYRAVISKDLSSQNHCMTAEGIVCQSCKEVCDAAAIKMHFNDYRVAEPSVDVDACTGCGACISVCPSSSIQVVSSEQNDALNHQVSKQNVRELKTRYSSFDLEQSLDIISQASSVHPASE
jgi:ferredoxin-type protein NapF